MLTCLHDVSLTLFPTACLLGSPGYQDKLVIRNNTWRIHLKHYINATNIQQPPSTNKYLWHLNLHQCTFLQCSPCSLV